MAKNKEMTWNEYLELQISRGATPELAMNSIGHMMVSVRMATDALTMASRKTSSGYRVKHGSGLTC